ETKPNLKETLVDFRLGYVISSILALCFLTLGAKLLFGSETVLPDQASLFASEIVGMYTKIMGDWSVVVIGVAACSIMFGTCIAVFDGYSRSVEEIILVGSKLPGAEQTRKGYKMGLLLTLIGAFFIIVLLAKSLISLVDIATCISFLVAPIIAIANYSLVKSNALQKNEKPGMILRIWSILGIIFLTGFSFLFVYVRFIQ
ncbi:MAG: divalent metal cation transporter, partial [Flavobacteriales bacterium]